MAAATAASGGPSREQLVNLLATMLDKRGPEMRQEVERRASQGQGLEVGGISLDVSMLRDALALRPSDKDAASADASSPQLKPGKPPTPPPSPGAGGKRWMVSKPSESLQAAKAVAEYEGAEVFCKGVRVVGSAKVGILSKPDVLSDPTGAYLSDGEIAKVVARYFSSADGRVYLRLDQPGWVSTRSRKNMEKVVLGLVAPGMKPLKPGAAPPKDAPGLEPVKCNETLKSAALRVLNELDEDVVDAAMEAAEDFDEDAEAEDAVDDVADAADADDDADDDDDEDDEVVDEVVDEAVDDDKPEDSQGAAATADAGAADADDASSAAYEDGEEEWPDADECMEEGEGEDELDADEGADAPPQRKASRTAKASSQAAAGCPVAASAEPSSPMKKLASKAFMRFRVVAGRVPVLRAPSAVYLMARSRPTFLTKGQEFVADGVWFAVAEQRAYLRLIKVKRGKAMKKGTGWVCERSKTNLSRITVKPFVKRSKPLSRQAAMALAYKGLDAGNAGGKHTTLTQDQLIKNKYGKIVSKKRSAASKKHLASGSSFGKWTDAVKRARDELGVKGFQVVKKGTPLYERAQEIHKARAGSAG